MQKTVGPVVISIEKIPDNSGPGKKKNFVRVLLQSKQGCERISLKANKAAKDPIKTIKKRVTDWKDVKFVEATGAEELLWTYEQKILSNKYKFGVLYCAQGQKTENEMYCNGTGSLLKFLLKCPLTTS